MKGLFLILDGEGRRLRALPRPSRSDDPARAQVARERWTEIKEQLGDVLRGEARRFEAAMRPSPSSLR